MTVEPFVGSRDHTGPPVPWTHTCCLCHGVQGFLGLDRAGFV